MRRHTGHSDLLKHLAKIVPGRRDGGLADVTGESVIILAERAVNLGAVDAVKIRESAAIASGAEAEFLNAVAAAL